MDGVLVRLRTPEERAVREKALKDAARARGDLFTCAICNQERPVINYGLWAKWPLPGNVCRTCDATYGHRWGRAAHGSSVSSPSRASDFMHMRSLTAFTYALAEEAKHDHNRTTNIV